MASRSGARWCSSGRFTFPVQGAARRWQQRGRHGLPGRADDLLDADEHQDAVAATTCRALRMITNTAAALSDEHIRELRGLFPQATLFSMYGLTECKRVTYLPPEQLDIRPTSVGRGMPNEEVWLVDEHGQRLPNGSTGELVIRGSNVMRGYWEKPERDRRSGSSRARSPGRWCSTRATSSAPTKRATSTSSRARTTSSSRRGEKVSPREVENVLYGMRRRARKPRWSACPTRCSARRSRPSWCSRAVHYPERKAKSSSTARRSSRTSWRPSTSSSSTSLPKTDTGKIKKTGLA